jgi:hypothetical protein
MKEFIMQKQLFHYISGEDVNIFKEDIEALPGAETAR